MQSQYPALALVFASLVLSVYIFVGILVYVRKTSWWLKLMTFTFFASSLIFVVQDVSFLIPEKMHYISQAKEEQVFTAQQMFYYTGQWMLSSKYFQTTNEATKYFTMKISELKRLNFFHNMFFWVGLLLCLGVQLGRWPTHNQVIVPPWWSVVVPDYIAVIFIGISLYQARQLTQKNEKISVDTFMIVIHFLMMLAIIITSTISVSLWKAKEEEDWDQIVKFNKAQTVITCCLEIFVAYLILTFSNKNNSERDRAVMKMMFDSIASSEPSLNDKNSVFSADQVDEAQFSVTKSARHQSLTEVLGELEFDLRSNIFGNLIRSNEPATHYSRILTSHEETQRILKSNEEKLTAIGNELII